LVLLVEGGVHGLGALGDHRLELVPVDLLGYAVPACRQRSAMVSMGTPLPLMIETNEWRSSRSVQFSPSPAFLVIALRAVRTWETSSGVPAWLAKTRP
jgi:hypothetical protein